MPAINYIYIAVILIAFLSSLISFRLDLPFHYKLFSCLLGLTFVVEFFATIVVRVLHQRNNFWIYNAFTLLEFWAYGYFFYRVIQIKILRRIIFLFLLIYPIFWCVTIFFLFGFNIWNSYVLTVGSFFSVVFVIMYYYQVIANQEIQSVQNLPEFYIAAGILIFYLAALPYFGTLNYLMSHSRTMATTLLKVLKILDTLMYALFSYGFLCQIVTPKKS
jgi:hypothetical protein